MFRHREKTAKDHPLRSSAAAVEAQHSNRIFVVSLCMILASVAFIEVLQYLIYRTWGSGQTHLINMADNVLAFVVGLAAMDSLIYWNNMERAKRNETRAIIRHNRIVQPTIDLYLARKNQVVTPAGREARKFQVVTVTAVRDLRDMYSASDLIADAAEPRIEAFRTYEERLNKAMMRMAEDIDFLHYPELCDAVLRFINAATYGASALDTVVGYGEGGVRTGRTTVVRLIKDEPEDGTVAAAAPELKNVYLVQQMIHEQEKALRDYLVAMKSITGEDPDRAAHDQEYA